MQSVGGKVFIIILSLIYSCNINRDIPDRASLMEMHDLEVNYALEHPEALNDHDLQRNLDYIVKGYIDTVNLNYLFRNQHSGEFLLDEIKDFYKYIDYRLAWNSSYGKLPVSSKLIGILGEAYKYGLNPDDYGIQKIIEKQQDVYRHGNLPGSLRNLLEIDIFMTSRYILFGHHLNVGRIDPVEVMEEWFIGTDKAKIADKLASGLIKNNIDLELKSIEPNDKRYHQIKAQYLRYFNIYKSEKKDMGISDSLAELAPGDNSKLLIGLKKKLIALGDLDETRNLDDLYDEKLEKAIIQFQKRHGLEGTGLLDVNTLGEMRVPFRERLQIININMERMKWFPQLGDRYILVNVPDFKMSLYENGNKKLEMKAIVGKEVNPTPVMMEDMTYIVFNPTWTVPYSITTEEFLPKIQDDIGFLEKNNYLLYDGWGKNANPVDPHKVDWDEYTKEDFPYVIVQEPGPKNALGQVQFMLPNNHAIYLHDTPADHLFVREERAFSHGCVRLERPLELAEYLLKKKPGWGKVDMEDALSQDEPVNVTLPEKWPVYLLYKTAWVDEDGLLNFRDDIYGLDSAHYAALNQLDLNSPTAYRGTSPVRDGIKKHR